MEVSKTMKNVLFFLWELTSLLSTWITSVTMNSFPPKYWHPSTHKLQTSCCQWPSSQGMVFFIQDIWGRTSDRNIVLSAEPIRYEKSKHFGHSQDWKETKYLLIIQFSVYLITVSEQQVPSQGNVFWESVGSYSSHFNQ